MKTMGIQTVLMIAAVVSSPAWLFADPPESGAPSDLYVTRSNGALRFDDGELFLRDASAPDLARLADGTLIATIDVATTRGAAMWSAMSKDQGRTWSHPQAVRIDAGPSTPRNPRHADVLVAPSGQLRMFFVADTPAPAAPKPSPDAKSAPPARSTEFFRPRIRAAVSTDGVHYRLDPLVDLPLPGGADYHVTAAVRKEKELVLLYADVLAGNGDHDARRAEPQNAASQHKATDRPAGSASATPSAAAPALRCFVSRDGRRFGPLRPIFPSNISAVGDIIRDGDALLGFFSQDDDIQLARSADGRAWINATAKTPRGAFDPAVLDLGHGSMLMLYTKAREGDATSPARIAMSEQERLDAVPPREDALLLTTVVMAGGESSASTGDDAAANVESNAVVLTIALDALLAQGQSPESAINIVQPDAIESAADTSETVIGGFLDAGAVNAGDGDVETSAAHEAIATAASFDWWAAEQGGAAPADPFAPRPGPGGIVDYFAWYRGLSAVTPDQDANLAYAAFIEQPGELEGGKPAWPKLDNMFTSGDPSLTIGPWSPADHPDWEASYQASRWLMGSFQRAAMMPSYRSPSATGEPSPDEPPGDRPLLLEILLPNLSQHRNLVKAVLSDGWREEGGRVVPEKMIQSWDTALRASAHMFQGQTLIEELVGTAERNLIQESAREALAQGVFESPEQIEAALRTLQQLDRVDRDPAMTLRGEQAMAMDTLQYTFWEGENAPAPNAEHLEKIGPLFSNDENDPDGRAIRDDLMKLSPDDIRETTESLDQYYRTLADTMRIGYPMVRGADIEELSKPIAEQNAFTRAIVPSLGRYYKLRARSEASRRATQLAYAANLFKAREGRWPASLDELPPQDAAAARIDPFSGTDFAYRLTPAGPRIYSTSENGLDDGGAHSPRWDDGKADGEGDDYVFWPPQPKPQ